MCDKTKTLKASFHCSFLSHDRHTIDTTLTICIESYSKKLHSR